MRASQFLFIMINSIGIIESKMKPFIVGGKEAKIIDFPYVAHLGVNCIDKQNEYKQSWICGSSIVNQYIILTAGHCVNGCYAETVITISTGSESNLDNGVATAYSYLIHENFVADTLENDIALVRLKTPLVLNATVNRVALMESPPYREEALVAGWGFVNEETLESPIFLKYTEQQVWEKKDCLDLFESLSEGTFCARNPKENGFTAQGDSGSALVVNGYIQIGIVSGKDPEISTKIAIYTDVGYFYKWIQQHMKEIMCID